MNSPRKRDRNYFPRTRGRNEPEFPEEACCDDPDITITPDGMRVCRNCAVDFGPEIVGQERRAFTPDEIKSRKTKEPRYRDFGARTIIDRRVKDSKGRELAGRKKSFYTRLSKIQGSLINSLERNYWEAKPKLMSLARRMNTPDYIVETAWKIYMKVAQQKLTMGRSIEAFTAAALYAAFRIHDFPRLLEEVVDAAMIPRRGIHHSLALIIRNVLPEMNLSYKPVQPEEILFRFGNELNLPVGTQQQAKQLLTEARAHGLKPQGKDPKGIAAAALYLAARKTPEKKTQSEVAEVAHITEVTLRTQARAIQQRA